mmetsp:Transcript_30906/g.59656  ORF Transcript_30906/g.59656 Transcript_30906/m.59656 type:complete len:115 (-) Transcript_30906:109-453(-)
MTMMLKSMLLVQIMNRLLHVFRHIKAVMLLKMLECSIYRLVGSGYENNSLMSDLLPRCMKFAISIKRHADFVFEFLAQDVLNPVIHAPCVELRVHSHWFLGRYGKWFMNAVKCN